MFFPLWKRCWSWWCTVEKSFLYTVRKSWRYTDKWRQFFPFNLDHRAGLLFSRNTLQEDNLQLWLTLIHVNVKECCQILRGEGGPQSLLQEYPARFVSGSRKDFGHFRAVADIIPICHSKLTIVSQNKLLQLQYMMHFLLMFCFFSFHRTANFVSKEEKEDKHGPVFTFPERDPLNVRGCNVFLYKT